MKSVFFGGLFFVLGSCTSASYTHQDSQNTNLDSTYNSNKLEALIEPYRVEVDHQMNSIIGFTDSALTAFKPESPLGNFAADILFDYVMKKKIFPFPDLNAENTMVMLNFGGLRAPINAGEITIGSAFELMPFDNTLEIVRIDSAGFIQLMHYLYQSDGQPISNVRFELTDSKKKAFIANQEVNLKQPIYVCTSDYLASGGDKMDFLKNAKIKWNSGVLLRTIFIDYIKRINKIESVQIDGRMQISK
jgi:2',3'-cyclic-nucleotide 2'-phosphodiesterase (5'-nucleotidase family)